MSSRDNLYLRAPLSAQSVISRTVTVAAGRFAPGQLGELTQLIPFEMVDEALAETDTVQSRIRGLPSRVVVYLLLAACLFEEVGYPGVWRKLTAGLGGMPVAAPTAGALSQARRRVGVKLQVPNIPSVQVRNPATLSGRVAEPITRGRD